MPSVRVEGMEEIDRRFGRIIKEMPEKKRKFHEDIAAFAENEVRQSIGGGRVTSWQQRVVGSKGGYAAVRPHGRAFYKNYAVGYITNAIDSGHAVRRSRSGRKSRAKKLYVNGLRFYEKSGVAIERKAAQLANELVSAVERELGGL